MTTAPQFGLGAVASSLTGGLAFAALQLQYDAKISLNGVVQLAVIVIGLIGGFYILRNDVKELMAWKTERELEEKHHEVVLSELQKLMATVVALQAAQQSRLDRLEKWQDRITG
jgi:hypothetical protein